MRGPKPANDDPRHDSVPLHAFPRRSSGPSRDIKQAINWRRGLLRVWLLVSASWIMAWIIYLIMQCIRGDLNSYKDLLQLPVLLLGPPIALLIVGMGVGWSFRGFKMDEPADH